MVRWYLLLLLLCLLMRGQPNSTEEISGVDDPEAVQIVPKQIVLQNKDIARQDVLAGMAFLTPQPFPGSIPWGAMHEIGAKNLYPVDFLIHYHPLLFLEMCLERYERDVGGYRAKLVKRERIGGKLDSLEKIEVFFREEPFSVYMNWLEGGEGLTKPQKVLYVKGENNGKLLARGRGLAGSLGIWPKDVDSDEAKKSGRYTLDQFGIYLGTKRSVASMRKAKARGTLHLAYHGLYEVPELSNRVCYKFLRGPYSPLEEEGVNELTIYIDQENWLQVGSVLKDEHGTLIAEYFFRDLILNPEFKSAQFTRAAL